jgi:WD40 repeat protein
VVSGQLPVVSDTRRTGSSSPTTDHWPLTTVKITDFGLAKLVESEDGLTATGDVLGTPSYMAPEQARGGSKHVGAAADVYSLGAILYRLLAGRAPFQAASRLETLLQVIGNEPVPPSSLAGKLPRDIETICLKCLQKTPGRRYASAEALAGDLRRAQEGRPILARPVGPLERAWRWARRNPALASLWLAVLLGAALATFFAVQASNRATEAIDKANEANREAVRGRRLLYAAHANLARAALNDRSIGRVRELLADMTPDAGKEDLRRFEWHYLARQVHNDRPAFRVHNGGTESERPSRVTISSDGVWVASLCPVSPITFPRPENAPVELKLRVWEVASQRLLFSRQKTLPYEHAAVAICPATHSVAWGSERSVTFHDVRTGKEQGTWKLPLPVSGLKFSPDGQRLLIQVHPNTLASRHQLQLWDVPGQRMLARQLVPPPGNANPQDNFHFSLDGKHVFVPYTVVEGVRSSFYLCLWEIDSLKDRLQMTTGELPTGYGNLVSPDGQRVLVTRKEALAIWDRPTRYEALSWPGNRLVFRGLAFSPDSRQLALGERTGSVLLRDCLARLPDRRLHGPESPISQMVFSKDGKTLTCVDEKGWAHLLDCDRPAVWEAQPPTVSWTGFDRTAQRVAGLLYPTLQEGGLIDMAGVWDVQTRQELARWQLSSPMSDAMAANLLLSPDGRTLAGSWTASPVFALNRYPDGRMLPRLGRLMLPLPGEGVGGLALAAGWWNQFDSWTVEFRLWDVASGKVLARRSTPLWPHASSGIPVLFSGDGRFVVMRVANDWWVWDVQTGRECWSSNRHAPGSADAFTANPRPGSAVAFTADCRQLLFSQMTGVRNAQSLEWTTWDLESGQRTALRTVAFPWGGEALLSQLLTRDGNLLIALVAQSDDKSPRCLAWRSDAPERPLWDVALQDPSPGYVPRLEVSPDGQLLGINDMMAIRIMDLNNGKEQMELRGSQGGRMFFTSDNRRLIEVFEPPIRGTSEVRVWDLTTGQELFKQELPVGLRALRFHDDVLSVAARTARGSLLLRLDGRPLSSPPFGRALQ